MRIVFVLFFFVATTACATDPLPRSVYLNIHNTAFISEEITPLSLEKDANYLIQKRVMLPADEILYIVIPSAGGQYRVELQLSRFIELMPNVVLICKYCASAAAALFVESTHERLVFKKSQVLMHEMYYPHFTAEMGKNPQYIESLASDSDDFNKVFYSRLKMSRKAYERKIMNTEYSLFGLNILKKGLADEYVLLSCDYDLSRILIETCSP